MVSKQSDGADEKSHVPNTSGISLMGDGGVDKGTGLYPMGEQSFTFTQCVDNSSTGAVTGRTDPVTYEAHVDNGPTVHEFDPIVEPDPDPEADDEEPEPKRGPGRPRKTGGK